MSGDRGPAGPDAFEALLAGAANPPRPPPSGFGKLAEAAGYGAAWLFVIAILMSVYEVVMRYAFDAPSTWALATTTTLCQIGFALGGAFCMARREHIRISYLLDKMPPSRQRIAELFSLAIGAFYLAGLTYACWLDANQSIWKFDFAGRWAPELTPGPPNWPLPSIGKAALTLGAFLFLLVVLSQLVSTLRGRNGAEPERA